MALNVVAASPPRSGGACPSGGSWWWRAPPAQSVGGSRVFGRKWVRPDVMGRQRRIQFGRATAAQVVSLPAGGGPRAGRLNRRVLRQPRTALALMTAVLGFVLFSSSVGDGALPGGLAAGLRRDGRRRLALDRRPAGRHQRRRLRRLRHRPALVRCRRLRRRHRLRLPRPRRRAAVHAGGAQPRERGVPHHRPRERDARLQHRRQRRQRRRPGRHRDRRADGRTRPPGPPAEPCTSSSAGRVRATSTPRCCRFAGYTNAPTNPAPPSPFGSRYDGFGGNGHLGMSLAALPDVNGDGYNDLVVGAPDAPLARRRRRRGRALRQAAGRAHQPQRPLGVRLPVLLPHGFPG